MKVCGKLDRWLKKNIAKMIVVFAMLPLFSYASDNGWRVRSVTNAPSSFSFENAPSLPTFHAQCVFTNSPFASSLKSQAKSSNSLTTSILSRCLPEKNNDRIQELARGLNFDWQSCYNFVCDNIFYAPYYGFLRGAERTLLEREGNDADQALLLLALLRECGYNALGNLVSYTNAENKVSLFCVDALGRVLSFTDATGRNLYTNIYDGVGNLIKKVDGNGKEITYSYDSCNRLISRMSNDDNATFSYDDVGNLIRAENDVARKVYTYDTMNNLVTATTTISNNTFSTSWQRDLGGLATNIIYGANKAIKKSYDLNGRLTRVEDWLGNVWTFTYDSAGRHIGGVSPGGISHSFSYDGAGQLEGWSVGNIAGRTITRDLAGRRICDTVTFGSMPQVSRSRKVENTFDDADRLIAAKVFNDGENDYVDEVYLYDGNGALTNVVLNGEEKFEATYNSLGEIIALNDNNFKYDALGNRVIENDRILILDESDSLKRPLIECTINGFILRYYIWGDGRLLGFIDSDNNLTVAHGDDFGSVIALTDSSGDILHTAHFGPNGEVWGGTGDNPTSFTWLGGYGVRKFDSFVLLYLTRHRLYSATHKRFFASDPMGLSGGLNLYAYAENNPMRFIDPLGLCAGSSEFGFWDNFVEGALVGDLSDRDTGFAGTMGQVAAGVIPIYGQIADVRDTWISVKNLYNDHSSIDAWINFGGNVIGWLPVFGDTAKGVIKTGKNVVPELGKTTRKVSKGFRYSEDASALIELSKGAKKTGLSSENAETLINWAKEYHLPAHGPEQHLNRNFKDIHIHIGPVNHISIIK